MVIKSKTTSLGFIEIRQHSDCWYGLYINGSLTQQSPDWDYINREFEKL